MNVPRILPLRIMDKLLFIIRFYVSWPIVILHRIGFFRNRLLNIKMRSGIHMIINGNGPDLEVIEEVWRFRAYTPVSLWSIQPGWKVVDLGANIGVFTIFALQSGAEVVCVEPNPQVASQCMNNIIENGFSHRAHLIPGAVWSDLGPLYLNITPGALDSSIVRDPPVQTIRTEKVSGILLSDILSYFNIVDLLKIDIEGAEYQIFFDPRASLLLAPICRIAMELHDRIPGRNEFVDREKMISMLQRTGFIVKLSANGRLLYAWRSREHVGNCQQPQDRAGGIL